MRSVFDAAPDEARVGIPHRARISGDLLSPVATGRHPVAGCAGASRGGRDDPTGKLSAVGGRWCGRGGPGRAQVDRLPPRDVRFWRPFVQPPDRLINLCTIELRFELPKHGGCAAAPWLLSRSCLEKSSCRCQRSSFTGGRCLDAGTSEKIDKIHSCPAKLSCAQVGSINREGRPRSDLLASVLQNDGSQKFDCPFDLQLVRAIQVKRYDKDSPEHRRVVSEIVQELKSFCL